MLWGTCRCFEGLGQWTKDGLHIQLQRVCKWSIGLKVPAEMHSIYVNWTCMHVARHVCCGKMVMCMLEFVSIQLTIEENRWTIVFGRLHFSMFLNLKQYPKIIWQSEIPTQLVSDCRMSPLRSKVKPICLTLCHMLAPLLTKFICHRTINFYLIICFLCLVHHRVGRHHFTMLPRTTVKTAWECLCISMGWTLTLLTL